MSFYHNSLPKSGFLTFYTTVFLKPMVYLTGSTASLVHPPPYHLTTTLHTPLYRTYYNSVCTGGSILKIGSGLHGTLAGDLMAGRCYYKLTLLSSLSSLSSSSYYYRFIIIIVAGSVGVIELHNRPLFSVFYLSFYHDSLRKSGLFAL
jgi:hypothetical protein